MIGVHKLLQVDGKEVKAPYYEDPRWTIEKFDRIITFRAENGLEVRFQGYYAVFVTAPESYFGNLIGLCGDMDGNTENEQKTSDGWFTRDEVQIGQSWVVSNSEKNVWLVYSLYFK